MPHNKLGEVWVVASLGWDRESSMDRFHDNHQIIVYITLSVYE